MLNQEWNIKPRSNLCVQCQTPFVDRQTYVSRLAFVETGYERFDYCTTCWEKRETTPGAISVWKGEFEIPPPPPPEPLKKETAESLLRHLIEQNDPRRNVIFILAVMLERRRILVERDTQTRADGALLRIYEHRKTGDTFVITDPQLDLDHIQQVQLEVMTLLSGSLTPSEAAHAAGSENNGGTPA